MQSRLKAISSFRYRNVHKRAVSIHNLIAGSSEGRMEHERLSKERAQFSEALSRFWFRRA